MTNTTLCCNATLNDFGRCSECLEVRIDTPEKELSDGFAEIALENYDAYITYMSDRFGSVY